MMETTAQELTATRYQVRVTVPAEEASQHFERAYQALRKNARLPGFRPGKAPLSVLRQRFGDGVKEDVGNQLLQESFPKALAEHDLKAIGPPTLEEISIVEGQPFVYLAEVDVLPRFELQDLAKLELPKRPVEVTDEMVDSTLARLREANATLNKIEDANATLAHGLVGIIDYTGTVGGKPFEGGSGEGFAVEVGTGRIFPQLEAGIEGMHAGEVRDLTIDFPADYRKDLANQQATFKVILKEIREKILPAVDDDFARDLDHDDLNALKQSIRDGLTARITEANRRAYHAEIAEKLVALHPIEVPTTLLEGQLQMMVKNRVVRLLGEGMDADQVDKREAELHEELRGDAEQRARLTLILDRVAEEHSVEIRDEEIQAQLQKEAQEVGVTPEVLRQYYQSQFGSLDPLHDRLREEKAFDLCLAQATLKEVGEAA
ncbi:MAG: trigger factor [Nitrospirae bacterium CG18_big_fil_WC_8_21_14_2_50_70_55]|nr:MAG: trigger factor [Nitrospirae bacterium CG2_30_70_394]PIQ06357.1 MAG: trigger factor [Nitrospirae bacterium CG18_big_fil_WC_8_21_14_2_50_70_55]PIU77352.1 MAG: trigger factor [Nitrospirae bacterium CG06_land_8_20_14_3_00_70_43]PIW83908.1 MAG: trigger factor [Nitrospirae bacterium CG_4_8_14_3_um_filter_70_85]PIX82820.1 MAG: trigger factor [Nitrospirae bacterium CG_4_10_14_3_um_filter_70_108]PJB94727.1 MAG: trigger factor [Nitrospirae bacterium CG_4_9_14_0_8_um_filter_70_14]HBB41617.1 trig